MEIEDLAPLICPLDPARNRARRNRAQVLGTGGTSGGPPTSGLALWFKGDAGLYQDFPGTTSTTPVTANGDRVGRWEDQSGNGRHAYQDSDANFRPTFNSAASNGIDGIGGVNCGGTANVYLRLAAQLALSDFTIYCVGKRAASKTLIAVGSLTSWSIEGPYQDNNVYSAGDEGGASQNVGYTGGAGSIMWRIARTSGSNPVFKGGGMAATALSGGSGSNSALVNVSSVLSRVALGFANCDNVATEVLVYTTNDTVSQGQAETYLLGRYPSATF